MIFAVFAVLSAVNMCINYRFFYIYICSFITAENMIFKNLKRRSRDRDHRDHVGHLIVFN